MKRQPTGSCSPAKHRRLANSLFSVGFGSIDACLCVFLELRDLELLSLLDTASRGTIQPCIWQLRYCLDFGGRADPLPWEHDVFDLPNPSTVDWRASHERDTAIWQHCIARDPVLLGGWMAARDHVGVHLRVLLNTDSVVAVYRLAADGEKWRREVVSFEWALFYYHSYRLQKHIWPYRNPDSTDRVSLESIDVV